MRWQEFERFNGGSPSFRKNGSARTPRRQNTSRRVCARWNIIAEFQASFRACYHHDRWIERESLSLSLPLQWPLPQPVLDEVTNRIYTEVECSFHDRQDDTEFRDFTFRLIILLAIVLFDVSSRRGAARLFRLALNAELLSQQLLRWPSFFCTRIQPLTFSRPTSALAAL